MNENNLECKYMAPETIDLFTNMAEALERFEKELSNLINMHSLENYLDMPDFLIAKMMTNNLHAIIESHLLNKEWHSAEGIKETN